MSENIKDLLPDFPNWFENFLQEQLLSINIESTETSMISYIKLWGIIEVFTKILIRMFEKRCNLREIESIQREVDDSRRQLEEYSERLSHYIEQYKSNIAINTVLDIIDDVPKLTLTLKRLTATKYSTEHKDIALIKLPSQEEFSKAQECLGIKLLQTPTLLRPKSGQSKYYDTRNLIAHEGRLDIKPENFKSLRIEPVINAVQEIKALVCS